jgi:hypothetical protein
MTDHFPKAFERFPESVKNVKTFEELKQSFKNYAKEKAPMTTKQNKALAVEARRMGIQNVSYQVRYNDRHGKQQVRYKDSISGIWTRPDGTFTKKEGKKTSISGSLSGW